MASLPLPAARVALALLTALTSYLTLRSWSGIVADPGSYLSPLLGICLLLAVSGLALRALRVPTLAVVLAQVALVVVVLNHLWAASTSVLGWVPTLSSLRASVQVLATASESATQWATPVPAEVTAFPPLLVGVGAVLALLVEIVVGSLRRAPLAGLVLIGAFTLPVSLLGSVPVLTFAAAAVAFALVLAAEQVLRLSTWGGPATHDVEERGDHVVGLRSVMPSAAAIGVSGVVLAVAVPVLLPSGLGLLDSFGRGPGSGDGGPIELSNPMLNLQRDLDRGANDPLVQLQTDDPDPSYLRLTVLDDFTGDAWVPSDRDIPPTNQAAEQLPNPPGLRNPTRTTPYRASLVATEDFTSQWLPTPYPATDVEASGDWRYDSETLDIVGSDTTFTQAEVVSLDVDPRPEDLVEAILPPRGVERVGTDLPDDMPEFVERIATEVTEGATSDFERVVMMQNWFRDDGGFEYTLQRTSGNGLDTLETFLGTGPGSRQGYCEQFAAGMALMARSLGIPARVAVGFLEPEQVGPDRFIYSRHDLHAWPEVYFEGAGWLTFDPTPSDRVAEVPDYTAGPLPSEQQEATPTEQPSDTASTAPRELRRDDLQNGAGEIAADEGSGPWLPALLGVAAVVALVLAPRLAREQQRRRRLAGRGAGSPADLVGVVEGAWAEVRATALDLDLDWDDGATLRRQAVGLLPALRPAVDPTAGPDAVADPEAARRAADGRAALERLVLTLERARYSRWGLEASDAEAAAGDARQVTAALTAAAPTRTRRRAAWLPTSLWRARRVHATGAPAGAESEREQMLL